MNVKEELVSSALVSEWRSTGVIQKEEIAYRSGDLIVAENVITKERRIINPSLRESNTNKRILKG